MPAKKTTSKKTGAAIDKAAPAPLALSPTEQLMAKAVEQGNLDMVKEFMDLRDREEAKQARLDFLEAMATFKKDPPAVAKDKHNLQYNSNYASLEAWLSAVTPALAALQLFVSWDQTQDPQTSQISVTCTVTHQNGHKESTTMVGPPDNSGKKNPLQMIRSSNTYLRVGTLESILGMTSGLFSCNDDGNSGTGEPDALYVGDMQIERIELLAKNTKSDLADIMEYAQVKAMDEMTMAQYKDVVGLLEMKAKQNGGA